MTVLRVMFRFDAVQHFPESLSEMFRDFRAGVLERREHYFQEEARLFAAALKEGQRPEYSEIQTTHHCERDYRATNSLLPFHLSPANWVSDETSKRPLHDNELTIRACFSVTGM